MGGINREIFLNPTHIPKHLPFFTEAIGDRISPDGSRIPLFYGEVKIDANNRYHAIPRTRPSEG